MTTPEQEILMYHVHCPKDETVITANLTQAVDGKISVVCPKCKRKYFVEV